MMDLTADEHRFDPENDHEFPKYITIDDGEGGVVMTSRCNTIV